MGKKTKKAAFKIKFSTENEKIKENDHSVMVTGKEQFRST